jgi:hypothetical protein
MSNRKLISRRTKYLPSEDQDEDWIAWAAGIQNTISNAFGARWFFPKIDKQFTCATVEHEKLILEVPKISIAFFGEMLRDHMVWFFDDRHRGRRRINEELIEAAIERHRRAQARRTKSNRRYERNLVARSGGLQAPVQ